MKSIPFFYYPTTVAIIDDDVDLLDSLNLSFSGQFKCRTFSSPQEGKNFLLEHFIKNKQDERYLNISYDRMTDVSVNLDISRIYKKVYDKSRFNQIGVLVLDYDMPGINGLELARELKAKTPIKIVMLTGEADKNTVIEAFNTNEIDRFIPKSNADYHEKLLEYIYQLQLQYFIDLSAAVLESLATESSHPLKNESFIKFFENIVKENNIVEFYLLDESGSFLMLDKKGKPLWLFVRREEDMQSFYEMANEEGLDKELVKALQDRKKIVTSIERDAVMPPILEWKIYDAETLGDEKIYYALLTDEDFGLEKDQITNYLQQINKPSS